MKQLGSFRDELEAAAAVQKTLEQLKQVSQ
jgi:hypothetical protein